MNSSDARPATGSPRRTSASLMLASFILAAAVLAACRAIAGVSLGLFFGGVGAATLIVPPLAAAEARGLRWMLIPCAATLGAALVWMFTSAGALTWGQWFACSFVLLAYGIALGGIVAAAICSRAPETLAAGMTTVLGLLWLTWPVWLSHGLLTSAGDMLVSWLVPAHPLFAINGVLVHFDAWDRLPMAYTRLSNLNQDVFYTLPSTVLPAVLVHLLIGMICGGLAMFIERRRHRTPTEPTPAQAPASGALSGR